MLKVLSRRKGIVFAFLCIVLASTASYASVVSTDETATGGGRVKVSNVGHSLLEYTKSDIGVIKTFTATYADLYSFSGLTETSGTGLSIYVMETGSNTYRTETATITYETNSIYLNYTSGTSATLVHKTYYLYANCTGYPQFRPTVSVNLLP